MRTPHSADVICVNCEGNAALVSQPTIPNGVGSPGHATDVEDDDDAAGVGAAPPPLRDTLRPPQTDVVEQLPAEGVDASQALADLMLEGWTMLADHCPR
jgi:hypothetical protein